jgi:hypothetical protein
MIDDQRVGDHGVDRALFAGGLRLPHAVTDHLAAAEFHLLAVDGEILLDLDDQIGVCKAHVVAGGRAEHVGVGAALDLEGHSTLRVLSVAFCMATARRQVRPRAGHPRLCCDKAWMAGTSAAMTLFQLLRHNNVHIAIPTLIHRACVQRGFDCLRSRLRYPLFQTLTFGCVGNGKAEGESRQEQTGLGARLLPASHHVADLILVPSRG